MTAETFDVVILGGGNAGIGVTGPTRRAGLSVAMIESHDLGGTCPNRGCTPKKVLVAAGHALHEIERAARASYRGRKAQTRLGRADRPREGDDQGYPRQPGPRDGEARGRGDQGQRQLRRPRHHPRRRPPAEGKTHRHRHRLQAAPTADSRRRAHDHFRRDVE